MKHSLSTVVLLFGTLAAACGDDAPAGPDAPIVPSCPELVGEGTLHEDHISADQTWTAADSPHRVPASLRIEAGATLTLEPCAVVRMGLAARLRVGGSLEQGRLVARGEAASPILIEPLDPAQRLGGIEVAVMGSADLAHVTLRRGASPTDFNMPAALVLRGDDNVTAALPLVRVEHVRIEEPGAYGVYAVAAAGFTPDSHDLTIVGAGSDPYQDSTSKNLRPVYAEPLPMQTLPAGGTYGGVVDELLIHMRGAIQGDLHLADLGIPYFLDARLTIYAPENQTVTFTLDPGVTLRFSQGGGVLLDNTGAQSGRVRMVANGTAAKPILMTSASATPAAGDWHAIDWEAGATDSSWRHVVVEYGGGDSGHLGYGCGPTDSDALLIIHDWVPAAGMIQDSTFRHSAAGGIVSGWQVADQLPDLTANNTFAGIASPCMVTVPSDGSYCASDSNPMCFVR